jgi:ribonuclease P protein component
MASSSGCAPERVARSLRDDGGRVGHVCRPEGSGSDAQPPDFNFPRALRLTSRPQFLAVYESGLKASSPSIAVFGLPNGLEHSRVGLTLTRKTGNAVERNRAKRVLRDVFRRNHHRIGLPMDLVINGRRSMLQQTQQRLEQEFLDCVQRIARRAGR